jgi:hypothetical protein
MGKVAILGIMPLLQALILSATKELDSSFGAVQYSKCAKRCE